MENFSLFLLEEEIYSDDGIGVSNSFLQKKCFIYVSTFETLEKAKLAQKEYKLKTIILPSYGI